MQLEHMKVAVAAGWIMTAALVGVLTNVTSIGPAVVLASFGLIPPVIMLLRWNGPAETMSEAIRAARR